MNEKKIAEQIVASAEMFKGDVENTKNNIQELLKKYLKMIKDITGTIPDEDTFIEIVARIVDSIIVLPEPYETIDGWALSFIFKNLNKKILKKWLGNDWYGKLQKTILDK